MFEYTVSVTYMRSSCKENVGACEVLLCVEESPKRWIRSIIPQKNPRIYGTMRSEYFCSWVSAQVWVKCITSKIYERVQHLRLEHIELESTKPDSVMLTF